MITYNFTKKMIDSLQNGKITNEDLKELSKDFLDKDTVDYILDYKIK